MARLEQLFVHPVKSLAGFAVDAWEARERGLRHDRAWMVAGPDGVALTQRTVPGMARVATAIHPGELELCAGRGPALRVPLEPDPGPRRRVVVWGDEVDAVDAGDDAAAWLAERLGTACRLVRMDARSRRATQPVPGPPRAVRFADELPLLVLSEASLADLRRRVPASVPGVGPARFRPNLVVSGCEPYAEDGWRRLRIGAVELELVKPCGRCVLVTVDPATGERHPDGEPLRTLAGYRRSSAGSVDLGMRAVVRRPGELRIGAEVELLA